MTSSVHRSVYARFVSPEVHTFRFVPLHYNSPVKDDAEIPFSPGCFSTYNTFDQLREQIAGWSAGVNCRQVDFRYTVHPPECSPSLTSLGFANPYSRTVGLDRKRLSSEDFIKVLDCCDQMSQDPEQAIANTRACWEKLFPNEGLTDFERLKMFRKDPSGPVS